jgi:hypothetical protein
MKECSSVTATGSPVTTARHVIRMEMDTLQMFGAAVNTLSKQSQVANKGQSYSLETEKGANNASL